MIEDIVLIGLNDYFRKVPKMNYDIENFDYNQLEFLINHMLLMSSLFNIVENFNDKDASTRQKILFHVGIGKNEGDIWSAVKIVQGMTIMCDNMFVGLLQKFSLCSLKSKQYCL